MLRLCHDNNTYANYARRYNMSNQTDYEEHYLRALKAGQKDHRQHVQNGTAPYLPVLDEILPAYTTIGEINLGMVEIPMERIAGTKTQGRTNAFASNFMPLLAVDSEFGFKWRNLCEAHLSDVGIRDPIFCYEFLGKFYVQEGNKRVSVLKYFGASSVCGNVIRILPGASDAPEVIAYRDFLSHYPNTKCYEVHFTQPNSFPKLQKALGYAPDHIWTEDERRRFLSGHYYFSEAFLKLGGDSLSITTVDAMLEWLKLYPFDAIKKMPAREFLRSLEAMWPLIKAIGRNCPIEFHSADPLYEEKPFKNRRMFSMMPSYLNVAFVHEEHPKASPKAWAHEEGSLYLEKVLEDQVVVQRYSGVGTGELAEQTMEIAIKNGAEVLFATSASLMSSCRKTAARHPEIRIFNCSVNMPYSEVLSYESRFYGGTFLCGVIAGAMSQRDDIGYIAEAPAIGVPAEINAFALGAQLTRPNARIHLKWSCMGVDPLGELLNRNVGMVFSDKPVKSGAEEISGLFRVNMKGQVDKIAIPYKNWGVYYVQIAKSFLSKEMNASPFADHGERAVNYWWGMPGGVVDIRWTEQLAEGTDALVSFLKKCLKNRTADPFARRIISQDGEIRNEGMSGFTPEEILGMDWLCSHVDGIIPCDNNP